MKIVVLAGGISEERDVSLCSGMMVYKALKKKGHDVILLDVYLGYTGSLDNIFTREEDFAAEIQKVAQSKPDLELIRGLRTDGGKNFFGPNVLELCQQADVVFLGLHGENGENGKVQATFDLLGIVYTGTDYISSAICMDKALTKELFQVHKVPTPAGTTLWLGDDTTRTVALPCVVKSCNGGSSVGVCIARTEQEYNEALVEAFRYDNQVVIEEYIAGREFSVGIIEGKALPIIEIAPKEGFYDYKNKYQAGSTIETCPAVLSDELTKKMQAYAEQGYEALRLNSYARLDFMMDVSDNMFCLEANTLPGMTPTSLLPQEAEAMGMDFSELCEKIIEIALKK